MPPPRSPCATGARVDLSTPANGTVVAWNPAVNGSNRGLVVQLTADGSRIFLDQAFSGPSGSQVSCFDTATQAACPGWGTPLVLPHAELLGNGLRIVHLDPGTPGPHGICAASLGGYREAGVPRAAPREEVCVAADKSPLPPIPGPGAAVPGVPDVASLEQVTYVPQLDQSYFAFFDVTGGAANGYAFCWNWTSRGACPGFNPARRWDTNQPPERNPVNGGHTSDYAYTYDPATGCMWGLGDAGFLWSLRCPHRQQPLPGRKAGARAREPHLVLLRRQTRARPGLGRGPLRVHRSMRSPTSASPSSIPPVPRCPNSPTSQCSTDQSRASSTSPRFP